MVQEIFWDESSHNDRSSGGLEYERMSEIVAFFFANRF
jgi:hypothetical protein